MEQAIIVQYSLIAAAIISGCASLAAAFSPDAIATKGLAIAIQPHNLV